MTHQSTSVVARPQSPHIHSQQSRAPITTHASPQSMTTPPPRGNKRRASSLSSSSKNTYPHSPTLAAAAKAVDEPQLDTGSPSPQSTPGGMSGTELGTDNDDEADDKKVPIANTANTAPHLDPLQLLTSVVTAGAHYQSSESSSLTTTTTSTLSTVSTVTSATLAMSASSGGTSRDTKRNRASATAVHSCTICGSNFGRRCELKRHLSEVHTAGGARRFRCNVPDCGKSFTRKDALVKHHAVKHQGKRRFVCTRCNEKFTSRYDLSRHTIRVHSNVKKRFTCEFCDAGFSQKSQLTMHKGRVHKHQIESQTPCNINRQDQHKSPKDQQTTQPQSQPPHLTPIDSLAAAAAMIQAQAEAQTHPKEEEHQGANAQTKKTGTKTIDSSPITITGVDEKQIDNSFVEARRLYSAEAIKQKACTNKTSRETEAAETLLCAAALQSERDSAYDAETEDNMDEPLLLWPRALKKRRVDDSAQTAENGVRNVNTEAECDTRTEVTASTIVADGEEEWRSFKHENWLPEAMISAKFCPPFEFVVCCGGCEREFSVWRRRKEDEKRRMGRFQQGMRDN